MVWLPDTAEGTIKTQQSADPLHHQRTSAQTSVHLTHAHQQTARPLNAQLYFHTGPP